MVSPLHGVNGLAHIARLVQRAVRQRGGAAAGVAERSATATRQGPEQLASTLAQRLREIQGDPHTRRRLLSRMLIESVLLEEFGHALINDAEFQNVVDDVLKAIEALPSLQSDLDRVVDSLVQTRE